jgi:hypothetical protein
VQSNYIYVISSPAGESSQYQLELLLKLIDNYNPSLNIQQKKAICKAILTEAKVTGFDPFFISSIIAAESSFCPNAVSPCEALGLMQLTSCVSTAMHINNPFNIQENIYAGTRFLKYLKTQFTDNNLILAAYNAGPTRVARLGKIPPIKETICYIQRVNSIYHALRQKLFTLLQNSMANSILCQTINAIYNKDVPIPTGLLRKSNDPLQIATLELYLSETERSLRFFVHA